ncbi:IS3 family transposase [Promicromonospora sp. NPDC050880]|uniref:IS3 family transposase n=1 Tax=Promicromonospora sp. NPDC050880 TaxID=3364406 RepID=UPI003787960C
MIAYIDTYRDQFGVELICRTLGATERGFITSRGYRAAKQRPVSTRALRDQALLPQIRKVHAENYGVYGARKVWHAMRRQGWDIGRDQCARLMRLAGLHGVIRGRKPRTTQPAPVADHRPDLVERNFHAPGPNRLWVADITYVRTTAGFCYTAFVTDVFSRRIAGWATRATMRTEALPLEALEHALVSAKDQALAGGWSITATAAPSTSASATPSTWPRPGSPHRSDHAATRMTTPWRRPSTVSTRPS